MRISDWSSDVCSSDLPERYALYADQLVHDDEGGFPGPLAGIRAGLKVARYPTLLVLPCDVPQIDTSLLDGMLSQASQHPDKRSEEHTSELQSLMRISYAVFCL